ncbi:MAG: histidinol-phosphate transaminase [Xanthomonadales bacterium]|nr:histidinol-phosphate transaminase [Gammaproteobacteria bacterium]NNK05284.1 histidinol-phosphate transaminase [Xanthomonadales bacterium]
MDINSIARPEIVAMKAYESARKTASAEGILLNANEAPFTHVDDPVWQRMSLNRYPPPQPPELRSRLAELYGVAESKVLVTRGSDEGIDLLTRVFCRPGQDAIVECSPCFGMYRIAATIQGARVIDVSRQADKGLQIDFARLVEAIDEQADIKLVFLTSPNNPTGDLIQHGQLEAVLESCEGKALVVLDEAYIEFCDADSACGLVDQWPQLVVLRTLSKAWAAAGVRCGTVVANPAVISLLQRVIAPYPLAATAIDAALQAISGQAKGRQQQFVNSVSRSRQDLVSFLLSCDWISDVYESEANFVLMRVADADGLVNWCHRRGIKIRNFNSQRQLEGCVRLSIGSEAEMAELKSALQSFGEQA